MGLQKVQECSPVPSASLRKKAATCINLYPGLKRFSNML
ncbi:hypothetical protein M067_4504 [Bacteroides fragilis str. J-143-4]|nr:hypothetical protein M067_4504 [Bacteroides fragilis str. J-143-4]